MNQATHALDASGAGEGERPGHRFPRDCADRQHERLVRQLALVGDGDPTLDINSLQAGGQQRSVLVFCKPVQRKGAGLPDAEWLGDGQWTKHELALGCHQFDVDTSFCQLA